MRPREWCSSGSASKLSNQREQQMFEQLEQISYRRWLEGGDVLAVSHYIRLACPGQWDNENTASP